jgi:preprotein translocase subunit SecA
MLAQLLGEYKLSYQLLNAQTRECTKSQIVAQQVKGSITIATNMAGRGTDIILGGNINFKIQKNTIRYFNSIENYKLLKKILKFRS